MSAALRLAGAAIVVALAALLIVLVVALTACILIAQQAMRSSLDHPYHIGPAYIMRQDTALSLTTCKPLNVTLYPGAGGCTGTMLFFSWDH